MSDIQAFIASDFPGVAVALGRDRCGRRRTRGAQRMTVEIADAARLAALRPGWIDLLTRADVPNVLMDPAMVQAAAEVFPEAQSQALLAWKPPVDGKRQLAGIWAFSVGRPHLSAFPVRVLNMPPGPHRYLATPVIDRACLDETLDAMLDALAADPRLPKIVALDAMSTDSPTMEALLRVLAARGSAPCILEQFRRPKLASESRRQGYLEKALSSSSRKKLRQHRRRLAEKGALTTVVATEPDASAARSRTSCGWKPPAGRAVRARRCFATPAMPHSCASAIAAWPALGCASIHALYLDGQPVSMQIVVRAGARPSPGRPHTTRQFHDFSPGMLLLEDYTAAFLADKSIAYVDSCSHDDSGYMSAWTERQSVADIWIDARRGGSLAFRVLSGLQKRYRDCARCTKSAYLDAAKPAQAWQARRSKG